MPPAFIDLSGQLANYRKKLPKLAQHLSRLDEAQRDGFEYKGVALCIGPAERPVLGMSAGPAATDATQPWQHAVLDSIALALLWADLGETRRGHEAAGKTGTMEAARAGFVVLAEGVAVQLDAAGGNGTHAQQRAVARSSARVSALLAEAGGVPDPRRDGPDVDVMASARVLDPGAGSELARDPLDAHLAEARADLSRLCGLPGLSIGRFGVRTGDAAWHFTGPEADALAGATAPGHPRSAALTRFLDLVAAVTYRIARDLGWLITPDHLDLPAARTPDARDTTISHLALTDLRCIADETASRARATGDRELYQLVTPIAARLDAMARAIGARGGSATAAAGSDLPRCQLAADDLADPVPGLERPARVEPAASPPPVTKRIEDMEFDGPDFARKLIEEATRTGVLPTASVTHGPAARGKGRGKGKGRGRAQARQAAQGAEPHITPVRTAPRELRAGRIVAAAALCLASFAFLALNATRALALSGLPSVSPISNLAPDVPSLRVVAQDDARAASVMLDEQAWQVFPRTEQRRRFSAACALLAANGYTSATFRDRRERVLATWLEGRILLTDDETPSEPMEHDVTR